MSTYFAILLFVFYDLGTYYFSCSLIFISQGDLMAFIINLFAGYVDNKQKAKAALGPSPICLGLLFGKKS